MLGQRALPNQGDATYRQELSKLEGIDLLTLALPALEDAPAPVLAPPPLPALGDGSADDWEVGEGEKDDETPVQKAVCRRKPKAVCLKPPTGDHARNDDERKSSSSSASRRSSASR